MKKLFLAVCVAVVSAFSANAQDLHFRAEVGGNFSNLSQKVADKSFDTNMLMGLRAGLGVEFKFAPNIYAATGLNYRMGGSKLTGDRLKEYASVKVKDQSISLPVNLGLRVKFGSFGVSAEAGPYLSYMLSSETILGALEETKLALKVPFDNLKNGHMKRLSAGIGASVAAEYKMFYLRLGTTWGLTSLVDKGVEIGKSIPVYFEDDLKNNEFYLNLGIRF